MSICQNYPKVSIVGGGEVSKKCFLKTCALVKKLINNNIVVVSGLSRGIDTVVHTTAIENGCKTIAVLGTPLNSFYPIAARYDR